MKFGGTRRSLWLAALIAAGQSFAQDPAAAPKLTPLPHPAVPPPVALAESASTWVLILGGAAAAALLALTIWLLFRARPPKTPPGVPPLTLAHRRLLDLLAETENLEPAETGHRVSVIIRDYQLGRYKVPAPYRTREELYDLQEFATEEERQGRFAAVALTCDQIAFSPAPATKLEAESLVRSAIETLRREVFHADGSLPDPSTAVTSS